MTDNIELPPEIELAMAINPVHRRRIVWRVVAYDRNGKSWRYFGHEYSTREQAEDRVRRFLASYNWQGEYPVIKRVMVSEDEIEDDVVI